MRVRALAWTTALACGCAPAKTFTCSEDAECRDGDRVGTCEPNHYCSFLDPACPSGRRYGELAASELANECVPSDSTTTGVADSGDGGSSVGEDSTVSSTTTPVADTSSSSPASSDDDDTGPIPVDWWNTDWTRRVRITVAWDGSAEGLTGVPVLAILSDDRFDASATTDDGRDLRFVSDDGSGIYPHQIDTWSANAHVVWFQLPMIADGTTLWLYYGNPSATDVGTNAVWTDEHLAVFHMGATIEDATGVLGVQPMRAAASSGAVGDGSLFGAMQTMAILGDVEPLQNLFFEGATVSAWIRPTGWGVGDSWGRILDKMDLPSDGNGYSVMVASPGAFRMVQGFATGESGWETAAGTLDLGEWAYVSFSYRALDIMTPPEMYIDGVQYEMLVNNNLGPGPALGDAGVPFAIGGRAGLEARTFEGTIDELRIESVQRPPQWHELQYRSMSDTLLEWGATETVP